MRKTALFLVILVIGITFGVSHPIQAMAAEKTGFLVIAPDRGYRGNELIRSVFQEFQALYPTSTLTIMGGGSRSEVKEQREPLQASLSKLKTRGVQEIVVIPLFISSHNAIFQKAQSLLEEFDTAGLKIRTAPAMAESYLTAQIMLDMATDLSEDPATEQLIVLGSGATNGQEAEGIKRDLDKLADYVNKRMPFKGTQSVVLFRRGTMRKESVDKFNGIVAGAAGKGQAVVIPFFIDEWWATGMMAQWPRLSRGLSNLNNLIYSLDEVMPHPNIVLWLKKTAAQNVEVTIDEVGFVIQPHGSVWYSNEEHRQQIEPLQKKYKMEIAFGMGYGPTIQEAITKLEKRGVKKIVVIRFFEGSWFFRLMTEYMLGLRETPYKFAMGGILDQMRSSSVLATLGGFDDHPVMVDILLENTMEISRDPASETVLLVAHGDGDEAVNAVWEGMLASLGKQMQAKAKVKFRDMQYATVREDWPVKRKVAVAKIRKMITEANKNGGSVLVIPARGTGAAHYAEDFEGLRFTLQEKGTIPNPKVILWLEEKIEEALQELRSRVQRVSSSN